MIETGTVVRLISTHCAQGDLNQFPSTIGVVGVVTNDRQGNDYTPASVVRFFGVDGPFGGGHEFGWWVPDANLEIINDPET